MVKVKPLQWSQSFGGDDWYADCYHIRRDTGDNGKEPALYIVSGWRSGTNPYETLDAAQAAAQTDFERRILSAIEPSPSPDMREAVEALQDYAREATRAITGLVGGGSELFSKQIGDIYTADLEYCVARIRNRFADAHEAKIARAKAERDLRHWREECGKLHAQVRSLTGAKP